jgi:uncharacterized iron-regulated protein
VVAERAPPTERIAMLSALFACAFAIGTALAVGPYGDADKTADLTTDYTILAGRETMQPCSLDVMAAQLNAADVVFVGENHDHKQGHMLELTLLTEMHRRNPAVVLSLEMFERDVQEVVDEYLEDYVTESSFLQAARPWPNYKEDYRPLIEFCKQNRLPVIAANAPRRYVNIVSRKGQGALKPLPRVARGYLAALPYSMEIPAGYSKQLDEVFGTPHGEEPHAKTTSTASASTASASTASASTANLKEAQGLWDATMADSIARAVRRHPGHRILQVNGCMHSDSGYGIADRLHKLMPALKIMIVSIKPDESYPHITPSQYVGIGDFVIVTPPGPQPVEPKP